MLDLSSVTLLCVDTANHTLALRALEKCRKHAHFARTIFLTDALPDLFVPQDVEVLSAPPITSLRDYSQFILKGLPPYVNTPHVLIIQWDGYLFNPAAWTPDFLKADYIGARWFWHPAGSRVGNGGFSLRSRRLIDALQDSRISLENDRPEDEIIGCVARSLLEKEYDINFADEILADRFSFEASPRVNWPLGFHGLYNFCLVTPQEELAALIPLLRSATLNSPQAKQLLKNCAQLQQWQVVNILAERILEQVPEYIEAQQLLLNAKKHLTPSLPSHNAGRNDPCPCGSGKRYKQCHGALKNNRDSPEIPLAELLTRAMGAHKRGDIDHAIQDYQTLLAHDPLHPSQSYLAVLLASRRQFDDALRMAKQVVLSCPHVAEYHNNLGLVLSDTDRFDEAIHAFEHALALKPDYADAYSNMGLTYYEMANLDAAIRSYEKGLALLPENPVLHWNRATAWLALGYFADGWNEAEWRLPVFEKSVQQYSSPFWDGSNVSGKILLIGSEQGLGDAIQFSRFASDAEKRGAHVILHVPASLMTLLSTVPGVSSTCDLAASPPNHDLHLQMLSLPKMLTIEASIPSPTPYLKAAPPNLEKTSLFIRDISARRKKRAALRVGLAWGGNPSHRNDRRRSLSLSFFESLLNEEEISFFSLQKGSASRELIAPFLEYLAPLPEDYTFDDTAALIDQLDLIISIDTSIAHLAGALGKPVWILLPYAPDWRWQFQGEYTAWYPSARLFRQPFAGDWPSVIKQLRIELKHLLHQPRYSLIKKF